MVEAIPGETMKTPQKLGPVLTCPASLMIIAAIMIAGCLGPASGQTTATNDKQSKNHADGTVVMTRTTTALPPLNTARTTPAPGLSTRSIKLDLIGDRKTGVTFVITGTTSLPAGTNLFWQVLPDTGTPPAGLDRNSTMSIGGNNLVTKGDGVSNRISQTVDPGRLVPGKYVAIVGEMKGDFSNFEIGDRFGYMYFTLK
jgi:hypothetical protein